MGFGREDFPTTHMKLSFERLSVPKYNVCTMRSAHAREVATRARKALSSQLLFHTCVRSLTHSYSVYRDRIVSAVGIAYRKSVVLYRKIPLFPQRIWESFCSAIGSVVSRLLLHGVPPGPVPFENSSTHSATQSLWAFRIPLLLKVMRWPARDFVQHATNASEFSTNHRFWTCDLSRD